MTYSKAPEMQLRLVASTESRSSVTESPLCQPLRYVAAAEEAETLRTMAAEVSDSLRARSGHG
jgi:hypothetical protein